MNKGLPARLYHATATRLLVATIHYRHREMANGDWTVDLAGYSYELLDGDEREIAAYHWHPTGRSPINTPHMHVGREAENIMSGLSKAHLPTGGVVYMPDFVRVLIRDFGVGANRDDWPELLDQSEAEIRRLDGE